MKGIFVVLVALVLVISCGQEKEEGAGTASRTQGEELDPLKGPITRIPDVEELTEVERLADAGLSVYFDAEGTERDMSVAPGEAFDIYVFAEFNEALAMSVAEWKIVMPKGVTILGTAYTDSVIMALGKHDRDFIISFYCISGPKEMLVKYLCKAEDEFTGGSIELVKGQDHDFLGFCLCDEQKTLIRSKANYALLRKK